MCEIFDRDVLFHSLSYVIAFALIFEKYSLSLCPTLYTYLQTHQMLACGKSSVNNFIQFLFCAGIWYSKTLRAGWTSDSSKARNLAQDNGSASAGKVMRVSSVTYVAIQLELDKQRGHLQTSALSERQSEFRLTFILFARSLHHS